MGKMFPRWGTSSPLTFDFEESPIIESTAIPSHRIILVHCEHNEIVSSQSLS